MTDGQTLYLVLSLVYVSDCFHWLGKRSVAFHAPWLRRWHVALSDQFLSNARGSLLFLNPLPPLGNVFLSHLSPVSLSPAGICDYDLSSLRAIERLSQTGDFLAYEAISHVSTHGSHLVINGKRFAKCSNARQAGRLHKLISSLRREKIGGREELIRGFVADQLNAAHGRERRELASALAAEARFSGLLLFLFLFAAAPLLIHFQGLFRMIIPIAAAAFAASTYISIGYFHAHKKLFPSSRHDRIITAIAMSLCPPAAIRAADRLTAEALSEYHPILAAGLFGGKDCLAFTQSFMRDLQHPLRCELRDDRARGIAQWYGALQLEECMRFIEGEKIEGALISPANEARQDGCVSYCPRCGSQYLTSGQECPDCPGVSVVPLPASEIDEQMRGAGRSPR